MNWNLSKRAVVNAIQQLPEVILHKWKKCSAQVKCGCTCTQVEHNVAFNDS